MGQRFDVCTPRPKGDGTGSWWHKVGTAWKSDKGLITIYLDSYPVPDPEKSNKAVMMLFEQREKEQNGKKTTTTTKQVDDDEIPF